MNMIYRVRVVTVPLWTTSPMKYFVYKNVSIESFRSTSDDLFQKLLEDIPALKEYIKLEITHQIFIDSDVEIDSDIKGLYIEFDFSEYEEILLYYKLFFSETIFNSLLQKLED